MLIKDQDESERESWLEVLSLLTCVPDSSRSAVSAGTSTHHSCLLFVCGYLASSLGAVVGEKCQCSHCSVEHAALVGRDHILDVNECVLSTVGFEQLKGRLDQVAQVGSLALRVINLVTQVGIGGLKQVHDWQDLSVVGHECLTNGIGAGDECLQDLQGDGDDLGVTGVEGGCKSINRV